MTPTALALLGFVSWTVLLLLGVGGLRTGLVFSGQRAANDFQPDGTDVSPFSNRLCRAHANCYENLPSFAAVTLLALLMQRNGVTDPLALWFLAARVAQSVTHLISTSPNAVLARFGFFGVQQVILVFWLFRLLTG